MVILISLIIIILTGNFVLKSCFRNGRLSINHVFCFSVGYLYYCIIPVIYLYSARNSSFLSDHFIGVKKVYNNIPESKICLWLGINFLYYLSFIWGAKGRIRFRFRKSGDQRVKRQGIDTRRDTKNRHMNFNYIQKIVYMPIFTLGLLILYLNRSNLFSGYINLELSTDFTTIARITRVMTAAYELLLAGCTLLYYTSNSTLKALKLIFNKWTVWLSIYSVLVLTMGGRLYVITTIIAIAVFLSCQKGKGIKVIYVATFFFIAVFLAGLIGVWRVGTTDYGFEDILAVILGEPVLTNWSSLTYIENYNIINLFSVPVTLFSAIIMLIPSVIFRNKTLYVKTIYDCYPKIKSPLGATHFFATYNGGLGLIPSMLLFFLMGNALGNVYNDMENASVRNRVIYSMVSANLMFTLFRDAISGSLIKNIFEFSVLIPWLLMTINDYFYRSKSR